MQLSSPPAARQHHRLARRLDVAERRLARLARRIVAARTEAAQGTTAGGWRDASVRLLYATDRLPAAVASVEPPAPLSAAT